MLKKIIGNRSVSFVILAVRFYLGIWFINHVIEHGMYKPANWAGIGSALKYFGITFLPQFWGFMATFAYLAGSLLVLSGLYFKLGIVGISIVLLVAANMHLALGQGLAVASGALIYLIPFIVLFITGPGRYTVDRYIRKD